MLTSITPLGERGRGQRWALTVGAFLAGATLAGAAVGLVLGAVGESIVAVTDLGWEPRAAALAAVLVVGALLELRGGRIPGPRRQVNENWLPGFRGWVYGGGFGIQLGLGAATFVTTTLVWATFAAVVAVGSAEAGLLIGLAFGLVRGIAILPAGYVTTAERLPLFSAQFERTRVTSFRLGVAGQLSVAAALVAMTI